MKDLKELASVPLASAGGLSLLEYDARLKSIEDSVRTLAKETNLTEEQVFAAVRRRVTNTPAKRPAQKRSRKPQKGEKR